MGAWFRWWLALGGCLVAASACAGKSNVSGHHGNGRGGRAGDSSTGASSGTGAGGIGAASGAAGTGDGGEGAEDCVGATVGVPTRVVRLTFTQVKSAMAELIGAEAANAIAADEMLVPLAARYFPPLEGPSEGTVIDENIWRTSDLIAQAVSRHVLENFEAVTDCGATPTDACGESFVEAFAEKAARRPLTSVERDNFTTVYTECKAAGGTVQEAVQHGVYAAIESPLFLYRFELGEPGARGSEVTLAPYEMASLLSFFVTDGPPDAELLARAEDATISDPGVIGEEVARLLETPAAHENLRTAMLTYFGFPRISTVVFEPPVPEFTRSLGDSMLHEGELFMEGALFGGGPIGELLTSRRSPVNAELAAVYGIDGFPNGATLDADGYALLTLPDTRAGLFTMPGFLTAYSRLDGASLVGRGIIVRTLLACESTANELDRPDVGIPPDATEREKAEIRIENAACGSCHGLFDPYGIALDAFDAIGRYRTEDAQGRPIDPSTTMPRDVGSAAVANAREMAAELARPEVLAACIAKNLVTFALADQVEGAPEERGACAVRDIERSFVEAGDPSFAGLVREVARSPMVTRRIVEP